MFTVLESCGRGVTYASDADEVGDESHGVEGTAGGVVG